VKITKTFSHSRPALFGEFTVEQEDDAPFWRRSVVGAEVLVVRLEPLQFRVGVQKVLQLLLGVHVDRRFYVAANVLVRVSTVEQDELFNQMFVFAVENVAYLNAHIDISIGINIIK